MINDYLIQRYNLSKEATIERLEAFLMLKNELYDDYCQGSIYLYMLRLNIEDKMSSFEILLFLMEVLKIPFSESEMSERDKIVCQKIGDGIKEILPYSKLIEMPISEN